MYNVNQIVHIQKSIKNALILNYFVALSCSMQKPCLQISKEVEIFNSSVSIKSHRENSSILMVDKCTVDPAHSFGTWFVALPWREKMTLQNMVENAS